MSEMPEGEGVYLVWLDVADVKSRYAIFKRFPISNGFLTVINGNFIFDVEGKPIKWMYMPPRPNVDDLSDTITHKEL
jgi:hypothetical protein